MGNWRVVPGLCQGCEAPDGDDIVEKAHYAEISDAGEEEEAYQDDWRGQMSRRNELAIDPQKSSPRASDCETISISVYSGPPSPLTKTSGKQRKKADS